MGIQGIIRPPPEIRAVADKTAIFVAKNGRDFETRILNSGKGKTPKFAFLHSSSPFHAYYEDRIVFYSNGGGKKEEKKKEDGGDETSGKDTTNAKIAAVGNGETQNDQQKQADGKDEALSKDDEKNKDAKVESIVTQQKGDSTKTARKAKSIVDPVAKALLAQRAKIKQMNEPSTDKSDKKDNQDDANESNQKPNPMPPRLLYTSALPPKVISQSQLEIIKLTAQFVALNGGNKNNVFLRELTIKEWQNPLYGFLQPRHGHYAYFTQLVDIYRRILQRTVVLHEQKISEKKERNEGDISGTGTSLLTMTSLKKMVGMDSIDHAESTTLQLQEEIRSINNMAGNIHSCLEYAAYHAEYDRFKEEKRKAELEKMMNEGRGDGILGGSSRVDWHDFVVVETIDFAVDEVVESLPPPPLQTPKEEITTEQKPVADDDMEASSDDDDDQENIEVVPDYTPKVVSSQAKFASEARTHVIDPITKKSIPIADMSEHMRIQLLDPKWAAEKGRFMEKQKDSNLVGGDMIARNVNAFTRARGDLFGSSAKEMLSQEEDSKKRLEEANRLIREQSAAPQPAVAQQFTQNQIPALQTHSKPQIDLPDAKRVRVNEIPATQAIPLQMPPPTMQMPPPIMQSTLQHQHQQPLSPHLSTNEKDTEIMNTKLSESDFANSLPDQIIKLSIIVPNDDSYSSWNFNGQTLTISIDVMTKIKGLKQQLQPQLGDMPLNKMQLKSPEVGFLKDASSLAKLNFSSNSQPIELIPKVRGTRK